MKYNQGKPYVIAETAYGFEGDKTYLLEQTLQVPDNIDAIKYHVLFDIDEYMDKSHSIYPLVKSWLLSEENWFSILTEAKKKHDVIVLTDDLASVQFCKKYPELVDGIEVHAACINDKRLFSEAITFAKEFAKTMFVGISGFEIQEVFDINEFIKLSGIKDVVFMYGFQNYPTKIDEVRLSKIPILRQILGRPIGYADHTGWDEEEKELLIYTAYALGANIQEIHFTVKEGEERTDSVTAISSERIERIADALKQVSKAIGMMDVRLNRGEKQYLNFRKVPVYGKNFKEGYCMDEKDIKFIRIENPSCQHKFAEENIIVGRKLKRAVFINNEIKKEDFY